MVDRQAAIGALVKELGKNEIYNNTFSPDGLVWAARHMGDIAKAIATQTAVVYLPGLSSADPVAVQQHVADATLKSGMFAVALTMGEITDQEALISFGRAVNGMYIPNDLVDGGGETADRVIAAIDFLLSQGPEKDQAEPRDPAVRAFWQAITQTEKSVQAMALTEDVPFVLNRIYHQVLGNEVKMQRFSREYVEAKDAAAKQDFMAIYGAEIAHVSTESAGAPSISSGLYALYRHQDPTLPSLADVYSDQHVLTFDRVLNAVARLWDEIGDRQKDGRGADGQGPDTGKFMLNVFNLPEPAFINEYLELAEIPDTKRQELYDAIVHFSEDEARYRPFIIGVLTDHMRNYIATIPDQTRATFDLYLTMGRRVAEIALVNTKGDEILAKLGAEAA